MPRALIVALVERGQHDGLIKRDLGADAIARVLVAIFQGFVLQKCWGEDFDVAGLHGGRHRRDRRLSYDQARYQATDEDVKRCRGFTTSSPAPASVSSAD